MKLDQEPKKGLISTALVDDDLVYREFLSALLRQIPEVELIHAWESAEAMLADTKFEKVKLLFVDLDLPGLGGLGLLSQVNQMENPPLCVVLTASRKVENVFIAIRNGASGYLIKSADPKTFQESLRQILHDGVSLSPGIARLLVQEFRDKSQVMATVGGTKAIQSLTERERQVLSGLARCGNAKAVGQDLGLSHETVRVHMKKIYQKLHVKSKAEAVALLKENAKIEERLTAKATPIA